MLSTLTLKPTTTAFGRAGQQNIGFRNRSDRRVNHFQIDFFAFDLFQRVDDRFERTLRVGISKRSAGLFLPPAVSSRALERGALRHDKACSVRFVSSRSSLKLLGGALRFHDEEFVARIRQPGEPENLHRCRRAGLLDGFAPVVEERFYLCRCSRRR